jgi:UDP-N-acetylenolpyruvoylglucosamine reductase
MLNLEALKTAVAGEFFLREELSAHNVKKVDALADIIIKPAGRKDLAKILALLDEAGYPHVVINQKGRVIFPDRRFHGAVVITDLKI